MTRTLARESRSKLDLALVLALLGAGCSSSSSPAAPVDSGAADSTGDVSTDVGDDTAADAADAADANDADATKPTPSGDVGKALKTFGVNLTPPARVDRHGATLPDTRGPLGAKAGFGTIHELFAIGQPISTGSSAFTGSAALLNDKPASGWSAGATNLLPSSIDTSWATLAAGQGDTLPRWAVGCDVDKDGFDEIAVVEITGGHLWLRIYNDKSSGYAAIEPGKDLGASTATDLDLACGDFRGDGRGLLVLAQGAREVASATTTGKVQILDSANAYAELWSQSISNVRSIRLATGDLDGDTIDELVVGSGVSQVGQYHLYKPTAGASGFTAPEILTGNSTVMVNDASAGAQTARSAGVAIGDVDGTGMPSLVVAGSIANEPRYAALRIKYDPATSKYATVSSKYLDLRRGGTCGPAGGDTSSGWGGCATWVAVQITEAIVKTVHLDGNPKRYVLINETVFDEGFTEKWSLPSQDGKAGCFFRNMIWWHGSCWAGWDSYWGRGHVAIDVGDFDGNGTEEIAVVESMLDGLNLWGLKGDASGLERKATYAMSGTPTSNGPVLAAANVDDDSTVMVYDHHDLAFTEPIPIAVMAAPPCKKGIDQNTDACQTSYGNSTTLGSSTESSFELSAEVRVGGTAEVPFLTDLCGAKVDAEVSASLAIHTTWSLGTDYSLTTGIAYTSGAMEDTIVFATIPYDIYSYKVISGPTPTGGTSPVGKIVPMSVPRAPKTLQAELGYYNDTVYDIAANRVIGSETFAHVIGDPKTYPTKTERDALLVKYGSTLKSPVSAVGQSASGSTSVSVDVSKATSYSGEWGMALGVNVRLTAGYVFVESSASVGGSIGFTESASSNASYSGTVGTIPAATFPANQYSFGLFTYTKKDHPSKLTFPVIQYWVE
jgi:hypothetical protein